MDGFLWKNMMLKISIFQAQATVFDAEKTANGFFQGFSSKVPCDMMYKKDRTTTNLKEMWCQLTMPNITSRTKLGCFLLKDFIVIPATTAVG